MRQRWERLTFLHWAYPAGDVQRLLPAGLHADLYDGLAWVGLVPFFMRVRTGAGHGAPWVSNFCETNVRTYVSDEAGRSGKADPWKRDRLIGVGADLVIPDFCQFQAVCDYLWRDFR